MALRAQGDRSALLASALDRVHVRGVRIELETYSTGGSLVSTPEEPLERNASYPSFRGFDRMQSFYADLAAQPTRNMLANVSFNMLGDVPTNPIDELFYENRGRARNVRVDGEDFALQDIERLKVYNASVSWDDRWFHLEGFYRAGHYHWGYEGDFFGLYQEANYGPNIDIYNGLAPVGHGDRRQAPPRWTEGGDRSRTVVGGQPRGARQAPVPDRSLRDRRHVSGGPCGGRRGDEFLRDSAAPHAQGHRVS